MKLKLLLKNLNDYKIYGKEDINVISVNNDSRKVIRGGLFVAVGGLTVDGHQFIPQVLDRGVRVVVAEKNPQKSWLDATTTYVQVKDSRDALGTIVSNYYGNPSKKLQVVGVTGTKGKTTTAHMIQHILNAFHMKTGLISSITYPGLHVTTPECIELHGKLKKMLDDGSKYAVIEVSSHGIDQKRIAGVMFAVAALTNIAPEHIDYHKTLINYRRTKMNFVSAVKKRVISPKKTDVNIFPGKFNNLNAEVALRVVEELGFKRAKALQTLYSFKLPKGRLEEIKNKKGFRIFIDFAHTQDSLKEVLTYLKSVTEARLITVFGCAGERDTKKRSVMGKISSELSDISIFTAEDPRSEDVTKIINEIIQGVKRTKTEVLKSSHYDDSNHRTNSKEINKYLAMPERGEAISFAIQKLAKKGDTIVILGKGHEKSMCYDGVEYPWSDQEAVKVALKGGIKEIKR